MKPFASLEKVSKDTWQRLCPPDFPFSEYEFLTALELSGSVGEQAGWVPQYLVDSQGASFLYVKNNSYGEYIFDWAWADAYHRHGVAYFPKVVSAIPFTPATGPKLLFSPGADREAVAGRLLQAAKRKTEEENASSLHYLFLTREELPFFGREEFLIRHSFQYHWKNREYGSFDDFLSALKSRKRKQILKERREAKGNGINIIRLSGESLKPEHAEIFHGFYLSTVEKMGASAYLGLDFFRRVFETMRNEIVLILAEERGQAVAGALYFEKGHSLFGRYWGASKELPYLHFELCYYQPIEYAIAKGLKVVEAGAQGEHKVARGFLPELTYSAHWIRHPAFREAIGRFIDEEKLAIASHFAAWEEHSPYHS